MYNHRISFIFSFVLLFLVRKRYSGDKMISMYMAMISEPEKQDKFREIYLTYRNIMYNTANRILHDEGLSEDAVHNAFLKIVNNIDKIGETNDKKTCNFLVIIAKNEAIRIYNSKREIPDSEFVEESVEDSVDIEFEFDKKEYKKIIFDLIKTMDRKYSEPLLMKFFYNYTDSEIADFLGITVDNAKVRLHRGKGKLKELLKESDLNGRI